MEQYNRKTDEFVIEDYLHFKHFSSFLPSIAGVDGKPLWAFYCNVGQCLSGFGVNGKETPLYPFESALASYSNIPLKGFRTLIEIDGVPYESFGLDSKADLYIGKSHIRITQRNELFEIEVTYSTVSHRKYPGLIRDVKINNVCKTNVFRILDGVPIFLPKGMSNYEYHELTTLASAYVQATQTENGVFYRYTNRGGDDSKYVEKSDGSGFLSIDNGNHRLKSVVDMECVFNEPSFQSWAGFEDTEKRAKSAIPLNKILGAFAMNEVLLKEGESYEFISLFGAFDSETDFLEISKRISFEELSSMKEETERYVQSLLLDIHTSNPLLDAYLRQSYFDNALRGGFPLFIEGEYRYLYSRKHGDMERDYNAFGIADQFYSSGPGNYRDVNQNRRNDLLFAPELGTGNLKLFFSLIEANGFNPLVVKSLIPSLEGLTFEEATNVLSSLSNEFHADYKEGYWIDHWVYNIDLLENYISIYPDKILEALQEEDYAFFDSHIRIKHRNERYVIVDGKVRQYHSLMPLQDKDSNSFLLDQEGEIIKVNLASKIFDLIIKKYTSLDVDGIGLEMYADKPGWNDSCNGLPGLLASSFNESAELLRLCKLFVQYLNPSLKISLLEASYNLFQNTKGLVSAGFSSWDKRNYYREEFEDSYRNLLDLKEVDFLEVKDFILDLIRLLEEGIDKAKVLGNGLPCTFFIHEVTQYEASSSGIKVQALKTIPLPLFLESNARLASLGGHYFTKEMVLAVEQSELYDKNLGLFKTSVPLESCSPEIGRVRLFTPGWLERESDFLHMSFKYLLGLAKAGHYEKFFEYAKTNLPCFMDLNTYGRPLIENVSFIVPSNHPNSSIHGQGFYARLTGANAEMLSMMQLLCLGKEIFKFEEGKLRLNIMPHIPASLFDEGELSISIFGTKVVFHNPNKRDYDEQSNIHYDDLDDLASKFRSRQLEVLNVYID